MQERVLCINIQVLKSFSLFVLKLQFYLGWAAASMDLPKTEFTKKQNLPQRSLCIFQGFLNPGLGHGFIFFHLRFFGY
jgi:hypothetical protein